MSQRNKYVLIFLGAFLFRVVLMVWDVYFSDIYSLPNSGADTQGFYYNAILVSKDLSLWGRPINGGYYSKSIGTIFYLIGEQRLFGHYINVLLGLTVVYVIYKILLLLEIKPKIVHAIVFIAAFFPNSMVMSAIFLREIFPTCFIAISLYYFLKWFKFGNNIDMIYSLALISVAIAFHTGAIGIFFGYAAVFLFYKRENNRYQFHLGTIFMLAVIIGFTFFIFSQEDSFLSKLQDIEEIEDIYQRANVRLGESVYLVNLTINNFVDLLLYGPIRAFYFLTAPLPFDWRGIMDIFSFLADSMLYFATIIYLIINRKNYKDRKVLITGLILIIISVSLVFGIGVYNAGTAIRHRQKIVPIFLILLALIMEEKQSVSESKKELRQLSHQI